MHRACYEQCTYVRTDERIRELLPQFLPHPPNRQIRPLGNTREGNDRMKCLGTGQAMSDIWQQLDGHPDTYVLRGSDGQLMSIRIDNPTTTKLRAVRLRGEQPSWRTKIPSTFRGRMPGEAPDEFYARVGRVHRLLAARGKHPTATLAVMAGVPDGTAAAWVSRARARGVYA